MLILQRTSGKRAQTGRGSRICLNNNHNYGTFSQCNLSFSSTWRRIRSEIEQREADAEIPSDFQASSVAIWPHVLLRVDLRGKRWESSHPWLLPAHSWNCPDHGAVAERGAPGRTPGAVLWQFSVTAYLILFNNVKRKERRKKTSSTTDVALL